jgi:hypothetical protein
MKLLRKIFGRQRKEKLVQEFQKEIEFFSEQNRKQVKYQAAIDGEIYWFERVCLEELPDIIKQERKINGTVPDNALNPVGN